MNDLSVYEFNMWKRMEMFLEDYDYLNDISIEEWSEYLDIISP